MKCFMIAVSQASTLDQYTNNFSLFFLLEEFTPASYPAQLKVYSHAFFEIEASEKDKEHEIRLTVSTASVDCFVSEPLKIKPASERHRVRMNGLEIPEPGSYRVSVDWRAQGDEEWTRESAFWPIRANVPMQ